jgi:hypothetical protein
MTTPPPGPPYPPYGGWPPPPRRSGDVVGGAVAGAAIYVAINLALGPLVLFGLANVVRPQAAFATGAVLLGLIAFGGGAALIARRKPWPKGIGLGLMIGWAITSIVTVGICTGLNPVLYQITR